MSYPPPDPYQTPPTQPLPQQPMPQAYGPPQGAYPPPQQQPVKPVNPKLVFWTSAPGIILMLFIAGVVTVLLVTVMNGSSSFKASVTSCEGENAGMPSAKIGFTVTNTGSTVRSATVKVEYRDGSGDRLDTDTTIVRDIQPGDTVRAEETTFLDAAPGGTIRCEIADVR